MSKNLGKATSANQISIGENVDEKKIISFVFSILEVFKDYAINKNDPYLDDIIRNLETNKSLGFPLNKHIELYIYKHLEDPIKVIKYILFRYKFYLTGTKKINLGFPPYILIELVSSCNLKCPFCFQTDKSFTRKPYMGVINLEFFKNIIDQADDLGVGAITLGSRGEPTMHKKFTDILNFISTKKNIMEVKLNTNGSYLTEEMCHSILKNNLTQIVISSDHYIKKDYERLRLGSNFEKVVANVDMLFNIRAKNYPNSITEIRVSGVDNDKNLDREKFKNFWIKRCDHVSASFPLERWDTYNNKPHPEINDPCENLWDRMYIWFDGKVNPCDADYKSLLSYGNAKDKTIQELWNNKFIKKNREIHLSNKRCDINPCDRCGATYV